jgi:hypothetical protein
LVDGLAVGDGEEGGGAARGEGGGSGGMDVAVARFNRPHGIAVASNGRRIAVADTYNDAVREIYLDKDLRNKGQPPKTLWRVRTVAGKGGDRTEGLQQAQEDCDGPLQEATFDRPVSVSFAPLDTFGGNSDTNTSRYVATPTPAGIIVSNIDTRADTHLKTHTPCTLYKTHTRYNFETHLSLLAPSHTSTYLSSFTPTSPAARSGRLHPKHALRGY